MKKKQNEKGMREKRHTFLCEGTSSRPGTFSGPRDHLLRQLSLESSRFSFGYSPLASGCRARPVQRKGTSVISYYSFNVDRFKNSEETNNGKYPSTSLQRRLRCRYMDVEKNALFVIGSHVHDCGGDTPILTDNTITITERPLCG